MTSPLRRTPRQRRIRANNITRVWVAYDRHGNITSRGPKIDPHGRLAFMPTNHNGDRVTQIPLEFRPLRKDR